MAEIVISSLACSDLREAADYISSQLHNQSAALRIVEKIKRSVFQLRDFPEMGTPVLSLKQRLVYRYIICGNYMIFYHIENAVVHIDRVLYGRRDYLALLFGDSLEDDE